MKIIFIDETDRQASATVRAFFCICGLVIDDSEAISLINELEVIKNRHELSNLKDSRKTGLDESVRMAITTEIFDCLSKHKVQIMAIVLGSFSLSFNLAKDDMYMGAMSFLIERFTLSLMKLATSGLTVFDGVEKTLEKSMREKFYKYVQADVIQMPWDAKPKGSTKDFVHPTLFFADDDQCVLIQAVDLIATSLNSAIVNATKSGPVISVDDLPKNNKFLEIYWPLFVTSPKGSVKGWGIKIWD